MTGFEQLEKTATHDREEQRQAMYATMGYIVPEYFKFPGFLSPSLGLKFSDVPNGLAALSKPTSQLLDCYAMLGLLGPMQLCQPLPDSAMRHRPLWAATLSFNFFLSDESLRIPVLGGAQIIAFCGLIETTGFFQAASTTDGRGPREGQFAMKDSTEAAEPGNYGVGFPTFLGKVDDPETRKSKLAAELANGRLAMMAPRPC